MKECARGYILSGKTLAEMCDHNEKIARNLGKMNVSMLWQFVKIIYSTMPKQYQNTDPFRNPIATQNLLTNRMLMAAPSSTENLEVKVVHTNETNTDDFTKAKDFTTPKIGEPALSQNGATNGTIDALNNIVYGENELTIDNLDCIKSLRNGFLYIGPHDLTKNFSWPSDSMMNHDMQQNARNQNMSRNRHDISPVNIILKL